MVYFRHMRGGFYLPGRPVRLWHRLRSFLDTPRGGGFTVIEVVIVLGISAGLFVTAAVMIAGRQSQAAFDQSARQIQSQIQQALNEVAAGFYPNRSDFQCTASGGGPILSAGASSQGTNSGCIFLGKALQFGVGSVDSDLFTTYTISGLQNGGSGGAESSTLDEAKPTIVAASTAHSGAGYPDNSVDERLQNGLRTVRMWYKNGGPEVEIGSLAFVNSLAIYGTGGKIVSGAGSVNIVAIDTTALGDSKQDAVDAMNSGTAADNKIATGTLNPSGGVFICFEGNTEDYAIVQIGGANRELSVTLATKDKGALGCTYP